MDDLIERPRDGDKIEFSVNRPSYPDVEWMDVTMRVYGGRACFAASDCNGIELTGHVRRDGCWELATETAHFCSREDAMDVAVLLMTIHDRALDLLGGEGAALDAAQTDQQQAEGGQTNA